MTAAPRQHPPKLREASISDYSQITALCTRHGLETKSEEEWKHLWIDNPVYKGMKTHWPIGWVLESQDKEIVGYIGNIPLLYEFQGKPVITAGTYSWVVDFAYRSYSVLLLDRYFEQKCADLYLSTTVNSQASMAFRLFNSPPVPVGTWDEAAFWITNYRGFALSWLKRKGWPQAGLMSYPFSVGVALKDLLSGRSRPADQGGVKVEPISNFDSRFDDFWEALRSRCRNQLLAVRTSKLLQWHFKYAMPQNSVWILTAGNGSGSAAYSIFYRQDNPKFGLKRLRLVDYQSLDGDTRLLLPMLLHALRKCRQERIHMLEYMGSVPQTAAIVEKLRPYHRQLPAWLYFYKARCADLAKQLADPSAWNPSPFDGDTCV